MNDFLSRLEADRSKSAKEGRWNQWSAAHGLDGQEVWDVSGAPRIVDSIRSFLAMVPERLMKPGLVLEAPPHMFDCYQSVQGVTRTNYRFAPAEVAKDPWKREGTPVQYVTAIRTYSDEGYTQREKVIILADGRVVYGLHWDGYVEQMYQAMSEFIRSKGL